MKKCLPLYSDDFIDHLCKLGLLPERGFVSKVTIKVVPGELVTMEIDALPPEQLSEALK